MANILWLEENAIEKIILFIEIGKCLTTHIVCVILMQHPIIVKRLDEYFYS